VGDWIGTVGDTKEMISTPRADRSSQGDAGNHLRTSRHGVRLNGHLEHGCGLTVFEHACKMGL
jgi:hypothetical protein